MSDDVPAILCDPVVVIFPGAAHALPSFVPKMVQVTTLGDWLDPGNGRVRGTVKLKGEPSNTPVKRKVRLIRERDGMVIRETWSDPATGAYDFQNVRPDYVYSVLSYDHTHDKRAVIADNVSLENGGVELMP